MASFYGGKQGITYHIVERYDQIFFDIDNQQYIKIIGDVVSNIQENKIFSVTIGDNVSFYMATSPITNCSTASFSLALENNQAVQLKGMVNCFSKGGAYTDVNYGEYVIIDTLSKSDETNGCLYRRGFQYNQIIDEPTKQHPGGGAIYIGQIVGPKGDNSQIQIVDWEADQPSSSDISSTSQGVIGLIPGIITEGTAATFNDNIVSKIINIKDEYGNITEAQLRFQTPYPVIRMTAQQVNVSDGAQTTVAHSYFNTSGVLSTEIWTASATNVFHSIIDENHPFYIDYQIAVPKGDPGVKQIISVGDNLYVQYSDGVRPSAGQPVAIAGKQGLWYLFATSQGAYHIFGTLTTADLISSDYHNGFSDAVAGWVAQVDDKIYAYDYIGAGTVPGSQTEPENPPSSQSGYLEDTYWREVFDYGKAYTPSNFLATTYSTAEMNSNIPEFNDLNNGGIIFRAYTNHNEGSKGN